jgi:hypothetical protein
MRFLLSFALILLGTGAAIAACGGSGGGTTSGGPTCDPGENIFCRCPGGEAGTKACKADGHSFEACVTRDGACPEIPDTTASSSSTGGGGSGGGSGSTGGGGSGGGAIAELYAPCTDNAGCASGLCKDGYCTKECAKFDECEVGLGECVQFAGAQFCMPACSINSDCEGPYGKPSACGYTKAIDGFPVTACADWEDKLAFPPDGSECETDPNCNLGHDGVQLVCSFMVCTKGCYVQADCPVNTTCSGMGALGSCK